MAKGKGATGRRIVTIRAIGRLWMPMCEAAWEKEYEVGNGSFQTEIETLEDAERRMFLDSGDLSQIEDYEIVYEVTRHYKRDGVVGVVQHTRVKVARAWKGGEETDLRWQDLRYPAEDDEFGDGPPYDAATRTGMYDHDDFD